MALQQAQDAAIVFDTLAKADRPVIIAFFGELSEASRRTRPELARYCERHPEELALWVDVGTIKDVHPRFGVDVVPTVLVVRGEQVLQSLEGAQDAAYYERALASTQGAFGTHKGKKTPSHQVTVYSTDTCPWCVKVKAYLRQHKVAFRDINVAHDQRAAMRMAQRSGQHGVPQVDIDGTMVVGFDRGRIDALLGFQRGQTQAEV